MKPKPLRRAQGPLSFPRAGAEPGSLACLHPFGNERLNSRTGVSLPEGSWAPLWKSPLNPTLHPASLLWAGERILVRGRDLWQLFDSTGKGVATERCWAGGTLLDDRRSLFYVPDADAAGLTAWRLADGKPAWTIKPYFGLEFERVFLAVRGERLVVVSVEGPLHLRSGHAPELAILEVHDLSRLDGAEAGALVLDTRIAESLVRSPRLLAALQGDHLVLAAPGRLFLADLALRVRGELAAEMVPVAMSLDEAGRLYLLVEAKGRRELWLVTEQGELGLAISLPPRFQAAFSPPAIGYGHAIHLIAADRILAVSPRGEAVWARSTGGPVGGVAITPEDRLLVTSGSTLLVFEPSGQVRELFAAPGEVFLTRPVLTAEGKILLASESHLYCLGAV